MINTTTEVTCDLCGAKIDNLHDINVSTKPVIFELLACEKGYPHDGMHITIEVCNDCVKELVSPFGVVGLRKQYVMPKLLKKFFEKVRIED